MITLSPVVRMPSCFRLDFSKFEASQGVSSFETKLGRFGIRATKNPSIVGSIEKPGPPVIPSTWQRQRDASSLSTVNTETTAAVPPSPDPRGEETYADLEGTGDESQNGASSPDLSEQVLSGYELAALRSDPVRSRLIRKLSEANQYNRFLFREVQEQEKVIRSCRSQISALAHELGALMHLAREIAKDGGKPGTRKINGRYIHSHLSFRLEELQSSLLEQSKEIDGVRLREIEFSWSGMAEDVTVMGSFDNWTRGESMSPESTGTFTKFSTLLKLRPGRYEIKFRVDGEWLLSPDLPTTGEGLMMNNLLIVD
ncbi:unnamed protein product [Calypogeia fissa]